MGQDVHNVSSTPGPETTTSPPGPASPPPTGLLQEAGAGALSCRGTLQKAGPQPPALRAASTAWAVPRGRSFQNFGFI